MTICTKLCIENCIRKIKELDPIIEESKNKTNSLRKRLNKLDNDTKKLEKDIEYLENEFIKRGIIDT